MKLQYFLRCSRYLLFESVTGVVGGVDRRERINSTDDVLLLF